MKHLIIFILFLVTLLGCKTEDNSCGQAYFGGEIINPNNDYLVLYDNAAPIDTLYLDENNRFSINIESLNSGLHSFVHGGEYQILILEPNDSIMLRLNTVDFDESLVFTGRGSKKNNYLIDLYLSLDSEDKMMYKFSKLAPEQFQNKIDSLRQNKYNNLEVYDENYPNTELFNKVAKASIDFSYYAQKELYPFRYYGNYKLIEHNSLPKDFYAFRETINYNDEELKDFYPYYNFLFPHFNNLALDKYFETTNDTIFDRNSIHYNLNKIHLIDSLVNNKAIKNNLLKYATRNFLSYCKTVEDSDVLYSSYIEKSTDSEHTNQITNLYNTLKKLRPGNKFPDVEIVNNKNETYNINTIFNKPTVVYFWTKASKNHFKNSHKKVLGLKEAYPNLNFISININSDGSSVWKRLLKENNFAMDNEYRFRNPVAAKKILAINYIYKVMIVNKDKHIVASNANMFSKDFIKILNKLK
ncbi:MAG: peroxiredoxin family protein [Flavobacteriaceae bacterium]|nr:peroxiredoxin family protein [Flavobacteriaceae bacterium]